MPIKLPQKRQEEVAEMVLRDRYFFGEGLGLQSSQGLLPTT